MSAAFLAPSSLFAPLRASLNCLTLYPTKTELKPPLTNGAVVRSPTALAVNTVSSVVQFLPSASVVPDTHLRAYNVYIRGISACGIPLSFLR